MAFVVLGGGISGFTALEILQKRFDGPIILISASKTLKKVRNAVKVTGSAETFDVVEEDIYLFDHKQVRVIFGLCTAIKDQVCTVKIFDPPSVERVPFSKLCICTGARPKRLLDHPHVTSIRDTASVESLCTFLSSARRVLVIGNGGVALEFVYGAPCDVVWSIKHTHVGNKFFDANASRFFINSLKKRSSSSSSSSSSSKTDPVSQRAPVSAPVPKSAPIGSAVGPSWMKLVEHSGKSGKLEIAFETRLLALKETRDGEWKFLPECAVPAEHEECAPPPPSSGGDWRLFALLSDGQVIGCDFVLDATGMVPVTSFLGEEFELGPNGGVLVDERMQTSCENVYACGDSACVRWPESKLWFQMQLWSQARSMAQYMALSMLGDTDGMAMLSTFDIFAHATTFFGFKVILLGLYNGQGLGEEFEAVVRECDVSSRATVEGTNGGADLQMIVRVSAEEYVKVVVLKNKIVGALLIGETDLEEVLENLICSGLDVSSIVPFMLDDDFEFADYFD